jgi:hypothetical protein
MTVIRDSFPLILPAWVLLIGAWIAHLLVREVFPHPPGDPMRLVVTLGLLAAFAFFVFVQVRLTRSIDEFQRQVHVTALAFAYPSAVILVFAIGFLRGEGLLAGADPRDLWMLLLLPYIGGYIVAARRYR